MGVGGISVEKSRPDMGANLGLEYQSCYIIIVFSDAIPLFMFTLVLTGVLQIGLNPMIRGLVCG